MNYRFGAIKACRAEHDVFATTACYAGATGRKRPRAVLHTPSTHQGAKPLQARKWVVADEYDEVAVARLKRALSDLHYAIRDQWIGVAGSQDIHHWAAAGPGGQLTIESETYVGLSVEGLSSLVADLQAQYELTI